VVKVHGRRNRLPRAPDRPFVFANACRFHDVPAPFTQAPYTGQVRNLAALDKGEEMLSPGGCR
jgi:hypothetical protein